MEKVTFHTVMDNMNGSLSQIIGENSTGLASIVPLRGSNQLDDIVSKEVQRTTEIVLDLTLSFLVSIMGIFTNIAVITVFAKQGFKESVGISMSTIAIWDFLKCFAAAAQRMSGPISLWDPATARSWFNICLVGSSYSISFSSYVSSVLAAYVAVERCLCVCVPLKIKKILAPKVTLITCIVISVVVFGCFAVMYGIYDFAWEFDPELNTSVIMYKYNAFSLNNTHLFEYYNISGITWPLMSLLVIITCTVIISLKLRQSYRFRKSHQSNYNLTSLNPVGVNGGTATKQISARERKVVKMLLVIVAIYIVNLSPRVTVYFIKYFVYDFYFLRKYNNIFMTASSIVYFFDLVNGSVNLFVFLAMSSAFRATYFEIFPRCRKRWKKEKLKHNGGKPGSFHGASIKPRPERPAEVWTVR